jgi:hypothetical protein
MADSSIGTSMPSTRERFGQATCAREANHQVRYDLFFPCFG